MTTLRQLQRYAVNTAVVLVIVVCAAWLLPSAFAMERYVITGGSMTGAIDKGSIAFEKEVPVDELAVGDVITYQPPADAGTSDLVTHRIVSARLDENGNRVFRTKGDANAVVDPWEFGLTTDTQPVVDFAVPHAGHVFIALADREVRMALVGGPASLIALSAVVELAGNLRRRPAGSSEVVVPQQRLTGAVPVPV